MIEIILALAILMMAILTIIRIFPAGLQVTKTAEKNTVAGFLTQEKMEELAALSYNDIPVGLIEPKHKLSDDPDDSFYNYERETWVIYVDPNNGLAQTGSDLGIKQIKATVYWFTPGQTNEKSLFIYTLRSRR